MRDLRISLNKTQKIRLERALELLESLSSKTNSNAFVMVSDVIPNAGEDASRGHGVIEIDGNIVATRCGAVEQNGRLFSVRSLRGRYKPKKGDIIVGRVIEVVQKRWRLDINSARDAFLMLSSVNFPDGIQRRRTATDELNMRSILEEDDVVCVEVRDIDSDDDTPHLQARSKKHGKLEKGQLLKVYPYLVKEQRRHFHHLEQYGVDLILGRNGFIWVGEHVESINKSTTPSFLDEDGEKYATPLHIRVYICRIANAIRVFSELGFSITVEALLETVILSESLKIDVADMLGAEFHVLVAEKEAERRKKMMANI